MKLNLNLKNVSHKISDVYHEMCKLANNRSSIEILLGDKLIEAKINTGKIIYTENDCEMHVELYITEVIDLDGN